MVGGGQQFAGGVADFNVEGFFPDGHGTGGAGVTVAAGDFFIFPGGILGHVAGEHEFRLRGMGLRAAGHFEAQGAGRDELDGKRQGGIGGVLVLGKLVRRDGRDEGKVVVEGVADAILCALVNDGSAVRVGIEITQAVGQIVGILQGAEVAADVHGVV